VPRMTITDPDTSPRTDERATAVAQLADLPVGSMKMVKVDGRRLCLVRTEQGVHAIDHACPHEGYGLTQGALDGDVLTCAWHNWKFRVTDGACLVGEEDVQAHDTEVTDTGEVRVRVRRPDPDVARHRLMVSLRSGIERDYVGQVSRDVVRLLRESANPGELVWEAVAYGAPRGEYGWGHAIASATDCLSMVPLYDGDERALPIVQAIAGIAESERGRPENPLPRPATLPPGQDAAAAFRAAVEAERLADAQALVLGALERGDGPDEVRPWFTGVVADHHLSYGHGAIYSQKAFELLDMIGWDRASTVLPHLVTSIVYGTREDTLPYMRPFVRALGGLRLDELAEVPADPAWQDDGRLQAALLGSDRTEPLRASADALSAGAGVDALLDTVVAAVSERMLRYDVAGERDFHDDFGWLDITHGLTYANSARFLHAHDPGPDTVRLALWCAFLAHWTGRHEWHTRVAPRAEIEPVSADVRAYGEALQRDALLDGTTAFIVHAHAVKTSVAASREALRTGSPLVLDATARFLAAPKLERFVAATVTRSIDFLSGRTRRDDD
jgi:nitrite reductase/ring-hydroxylating ferredoxin subunit